MAARSTVGRRLSTPLRCRLGLHAWVQAHPPDERPQGPDHKICRRCGKRRPTGLDDLPPGFLGGLGSGGGMQ